MFCLKRDYGIKVQNEPRNRFRMEHWGDVSHGRGGSATGAALGDPTRGRGGGIGGT